MKYMVTTSPGLEAEMALELEGLVGKGPVFLQSGVHEIEVDLAGLCQILCGSRLASRVLMPLASFHAWEKDVLYREALSISWDRLIAPDETFACDVHGQCDDCDYSQLQGLLKIKDAIVDQIRSRRGERPNVDKENPTHQIEIHFWKGRCDISMDLCGEPLHKRFYRKAQGVAPLRESRAAALLKLAGLEKGFWAALHDPFCGLGTIPIEAALMARKIPAANRRPIPRKKFIDGFHEDYLACLNRMREESLRSCPVRIVASDSDPKAIAKARKAAVLAGVAEDIEFSVEKFQNQDFKGPGPRLLVTNPPYGERLGETDEARALLRELGKKIKFDSDVSVMVVLLLKGMELEPGLRPELRKSWRAGDLDLTACRYKLWKGNQREIK